MCLQQGEYFITTVQETYLWLEQDKPNGIG